MFHVATMIDGSTDEDRLRKKTRHIGNDEVQIIWTEHYHEYDRSIIASAFGDVLIVIHPLPNGLYRIRIDKTSQVRRYLDFLLIIFCLFFFRQQILVHYLMVQLLINLFFQN